MTTPLTGIDLGAYSDDELQAHFNTIMDALPDGGHFSWDWPTLAMVFPDTYQELTAIRSEANRRLKERGHFLGLKA